MKMFTSNGIQLFLAPVGLNSVPYRNCLTFRETINAISNQGRKNETKLILYQTTKSSQTSCTAAMAFQYTVHVYL